MKSVPSNRRDFFKSVAVGGAAAAAAVVTTVVGQRNAPTDTGVANASKQVGYHETPHIRHYYRTTQV